MTLLSALVGDAEIEAILDDGAQLAALLQVERSLATASAQAGWISVGAAEAIGAAIGNFRPDWTDLTTGMVRDGVVVPALVAQLRRLVAEPHRAALHKGATSQDIVDTALMLQVAKVVDVIETRLSTLLSRLDELQGSDGHRRLMAHTRMQAALETTWGDKLRSWADPLQRHLRALETMRRGLLVVQLGGPVGDRRSFEEHGDAIAAALGKSLDLGIAAPWHATRDPIVAFGDRLALISGSMGKIGADVTLLAQTEVGAVTLTGGGGSSAMSHKSNPVTAEALVALGRLTAGLSGTLHQAMLHEYERSGAAWTLEWLTLPPLMVATGASLRVGLDLLDQIKLT